MNVNRTPKSSPHPETELSKGAFKVYTATGFSHPYSFGFPIKPQWVTDYSHLTDEVKTEESIDFSGL